MDPDRDDRDYDVSAQPIIDAIDEVLRRVHDVRVGDDETRKAEKERVRMILEGVRDVVTGAFGDEHQSFHFFHLFLDRP